MIVDEPSFMPYAPGKPVTSIVKRIYEGTIPSVLTLKSLQSLGVASGNADRVQKALRFLGLISSDFLLTNLAMELRKTTSDEYRSQLGAIISDAYNPVFVSYNPATAIAADLNNAFKPFDPAGQRPNMIALFMALCREAGLAPEATTLKPGRVAGAPSNPKGEHTRVGTQNRSKPITPPLAPPSTKGTSKTVTLRNGGGQVTLMISVDLMELEGAEREFVFGLIDKLKAYAQPLTRLNP